MDKELADKVSRSRQESEPSDEAISPDPVTYIHPETGQMRILYKRGEWTTRLEMLLSAGFMAVPDREGT